MKKNRLLYFLLLTAICTSCHKADVNNFTGTYSYKTSGSIKVGTILENSSYPLNNEIGTIHILKNKSSEEYDVTIMINEVGGGVYTAYGNIDGNEITIAPYKRPLDLKLLSLISENITIECKGSGTLSDGVITIKQFYYGTSGDLIFIGSDITTIAELNE